MATENKPFDPASLGKVVLLLGGRSSEREVSLMSGKGVYDALVEAGVDVTRFDPQSDDLSELEKGEYDRAIISLHGRFGEDGTIQGVLEYLGIPYTGPGVRASAIAIDKAMTKRVWRTFNIPVPKGMLVTKDSDMRFVIQELGRDLVVKPSHEGSSIGLTKLKDATVEELTEAVVKASNLDHQVLVEERIFGRELTVTILGSGEDARALPIIEIVAPNGVRYDCPANLPQELADEIASTCVKAYHALGGRGWSRIDVMLTEDGRFVLLEMNTSPGMTAHSLVPLSAKVSGLSYQDLVLAVLRDASLDLKH